MSDHPHLLSPAFSSPGRTPAISRPAWPWQPSSSRPQSTSSSASLEHRPSLLNSSRSTSSPGTYSSSTSLTWQPNTTSRSAASSGFFMGSIGMSNIQEDNTRQWSFLGFEWIVRDVHKLRDFVEGVNAEDAGDLDFDVLKQSPTLGDNKFKLEIAFTPPHPEASSGSCDKSTLSLYITSLMVDLAHADYELSASMMTAIKTQPNHAGERAAPAEWVWDFWQTEWVFRREHEVWECPLPPLSVLLENSKIQETDCFVICVQIHCPASLSYPQQPSLYPVPRDLLEGLEASLDNANTGDVRFVCLERLAAETQLSPKTHQPDPTTPSRRSSSSTSSHVTFSTVTTARKRVIYAHSDILIRRSEYFATMLASSFSENPDLVAGERKIYTIVVEEADFETVYWLLKFCYTNWLLFREQDDPRMAIDGAGVGWSAKWLHSRGGEWDWKTFHKDDNVASDTKSVASGESLRSVSKPSGAPEKLDPLQHIATTVAVQTSRSLSSIRTTPSPTKVTPATPSSNAAPSTSSRRATSVLNSSSVSNKSGTTKPIQIPLRTANFTSPSRSNYPLSPRGSRQYSLAPISTPDPHLHPAASPKPASALSIYQVAHRYAMPGLAALALEHMLSTVTPQSSFPLLLASSVWDELYTLVEDYVIEKWDEVSISEEFEQCCQEIAAGEWGSEGGKTLMSIFRRLRSPNSTS